MNSLSCWYESVWEAHAPWQGSGNSVIAVAGNQASNAPNAVTQRCRGRGRVEHLEQGNAIMPRQQDKRDEASQESAKPRKAVLADQDFRVRKKVSRRFEHVVQLRAHKSRDA